MGNTYQKSRGSAGSKGVDFQINLLSMFLLNALRRNIKDWKLSTENKLAKKFDDVVFELSNGSAILLQAKHKDNKKIDMGQLLSTNSKNDDFSLPKYFCSYLDIRGIFEVEFVIICTNAQVNSKITKFLNPHTVSEDSMLFSQCGEIFFYTFSESIVSDLLSNTKVYYKNNLKGKGLDEKLITVENAKEFLKHLQFFSDYPSGNQLEKVAEKILSDLKSTDTLLRNISFQDIYLKVKEWFEQPKGEYLTESRAKAMFCEIRSEKFCESLEDYKVFFKSNDLPIWNLSKTRIFHVVAERGDLLQLIKVYRSLKENEVKALYAMPEDGLDVQKLIIRSFELPKYSYLIIVSPIFTEEEICNKLKDVLDNKDYKRIIFVAASNNTLVKLMKSLEDCDVFDKPISLEELSKYTQEILLKKETIMFQGEKTSLQELLPERITESYKKFVESEILQKMLKNEKITIGKGVVNLQDEISRYYVERKFERVIKKYYWRDHGNSREREDTFSEEEIFNIEGKIILISDSAGTGKTTVLTNLASKIKKNHPRLWVIRIELNECTRMLKDILKNGRPLNVEELLNCTEVTDTPNQLEKMVFSFKEKIVLMFDGVDEISPDYTELIVNLLVDSEKAENVAKIFVTTRPHMTPELENRLDTVTSFTLTTFTENNTIHYLTSYWIYNLSVETENHNKCMEYAEKLVKKITFLMFNYDEEKNNQFITFPLYVKMLAEVFLGNQGSQDWEGCKEFLSAEKTQEPILPERMNIAKLYGMFIEKKRDIFMDKGNPSGNATANQALMDQFEDCLTHHRSLAMKVVLDKAACSLFSSGPHDIKDKEVQILKMGIIQKLNDQLNFVHRTFAEFFVAESLRNELQLLNKEARFQRFLINEVFSNPQFNMIRHFLDNLLQTVVPLIPPDIFENYKSYFGFNDPNLIHTLAKGGCTEIIRLLLKCLNYDDTKHSGNILEDFLQRDGIDIRDEEDLTSLHYAVLEGHLETVRLFVENGADVNSDSEVIDTTLHLAVSKGRAGVVEFLLKSRADINIVDRNGRPPLHIAIKNGRQDLFELLLKHGADVNIADSKGRTALHLSARSSNYQIFKSLVENDGTDVNAVDRRGRTTLHFATKGHFCRAILEFLLDHGIDVNTVDKNGNTPLHFATKEWSAETVEFLADHGADIEVANEDLNTALHLAVFEGSLRVVETLLVHGADVNKVGQKGCTALHFTAAIDNREALAIIDLLLNYGGDINARNEEGSTPLHFTTRSENSNICEYLIEHGADINVADKKGHTALHSALLSGRWDIVETLVKHKVNIEAISENDNDGIVDFLVKHGVNVDFSKGGDRTSLYLAVSDGRWDIVESLGRYGVDLDTADDQGRRPLHFAAENGNCETVELLLQQLVTVDAKDEKRRTALHLALLASKWDIVECLVKHGADVNATDESGRTALHLAVDGDDDSCDMVMFLMEHGADVKVEDDEGRTAVHLAGLREKWNILEFLLEHGAVEDFPPEK